MRAPRPSLLLAALLSAAAAPALGQSASDMRMLIRQSDVIAMPDITIDLDAAPTERIAIVIGNGDYAAVPDLKNTVSDAVAVAGMLRRGGFAVTELHDLTKRGFEEILRSILFEVDKGADLVVYYAGHGVQIGRNNYLIPTDADIDSVYDVPFEAVSLSSMLSIAGTRARSLTVILDSCRNNPFPGQSAITGLDDRPEEMQTGFTAQDTPINALVVFSTSPGAVALDGRGSNSPFTEALIEVIGNAPERPLDELMKDVRRRVYQTTLGRQIPWESSSLVEPVALGSSGPSDMIHPMEGATVSEDHMGVLTVTAGLDRAVPLGEALRGGIGAGGGAMQVMKNPVAGRLEVEMDARWRALPDMPVAADTLGRMVYRSMSGERAATGLGGTTISDSFDIALEDGTRTVQLNLEVDPCDYEAGDWLDPDGVGVARYPNDIDTDRALPACRDAVAREPGNGRFQYQLGRVHLALRALDAAEASFRRAVELGHTRAFHAMGTIETAKVTAVGGKAPDTALAWYAQGVARGDPYAFHALGRQLLLFGESREDRRQGFELLSRAQELGHTYSMNELGRYFTQEGVSGYDPERGVRYWQESAARGDIYGYANLGWAYRNGVGGLPVDKARALDWYMKAADGQHPTAPAAIARMFEAGDVGGRKDIAEAVRWNDKGLTRGDPWAGVNGAILILRDRPAGFEQADGAVRAAKAAALRHEQARGVALKLLDRLDRKVLDAASQMLLREFGQDIGVDGAFGPGSRAALDALAAETGESFPEDPLDRLLALAAIHWDRSPFRVEVF